METFGRQPAVQHFEQTVAHELGVHDAAIKKDVGGASQTARAAPHGIVFGSRGLLAEEAREMACDGRVGGIGEAHFLQSGAARQVRHIRALRARQETFENVLNLLAMQFGFDGSAGSISSLCRES